MPQQFDYLDDRTAAVFKQFMTGQRTAAGQENPLLAELARRGSPAPSVAAVEQVLQRGAQEVEVPTPIRAQ